MSVGGIKRLNKEWINFIIRPIDGISLGPFGDDIFHWDAVIMGMPGTSYEGGTFILEIVFSDKYPFVPPKVSFKTPIYHPNIDENGYISLDILRDRWAPAVTMEKVLLQIRLMLDDPNSDDPLMPEIARLCKNDRDKYEQNVREWTRKYAM